MLRSVTGTSPVLEDETDRREKLVIEKLVLINFKSYAGRQVIGPFHNVHPWGELYLCSRLRRLWDRTDQASPMSLTL